MHASFVPGSSGRNGLITLDRVGPHLVELASHSYVAAPDRLCSATSKGQPCAFIAVDHMLLGGKHLLVAPDFLYRRPCIRRIQDNISYNEG